MKILFCNVAPMEKYQGVENNQILHGGKYIEKHGVGFELYNFREINGKYYGFVQPPTGGKKTTINEDELNKFKLAKINIDNLGALKASDHVNDVLVVWTATHKEGGRAIVGWYKNATVYRTQQKFKDERRRFVYPDGKIDYASFYIECDVNKAVLLPMENRKFKLPKRSMGQANIWYGNHEVNQDVINYINHYGGFSMYDKYGLKERIDEEIKDIPDKYKETFIKTRIGQSLFRSALLQKYNSTCAICGVKGDEFLVASHIKAWKDCVEGEHLDEDNGLLLCPNHDKLFDSHLISFDNNGRILISKRLSDNNKIFLNVCNSFNIEINEKNRKYVEFHRNIFYSMEKE